MSKNTQKTPQVKEINFNGKIYEIESLTPRVINSFNNLVKLQSELNEIAYVAAVKQAAQKQMSLELEGMIKEDKIKEIAEQEQVKDDSEK
jgi:hypothetical protein